MGLTVIGSVALAAATVIVLALVMAILFWQLLANVVMVAFVQEMRWYGDGIYTAGGDLWWWVFGISAAGVVVLAAGVAMLVRAEAEVPRPWRRRPA
jgi:hypothetical protein